MASGFFIDWDGKARSTDDPGAGYRCEVDGVARYVAVLGKGGATVHEATLYRSLEDIAKAGKFAVEKFAQALLPVRDSLQMALADTTSAVETLRSGVEITLKQLDSAFQGAQLIEVNPLGEKFDPHRHQAISTQEHEGEANLVLNVFQKGYLLNERVIRPALVVVSKAKETS